MPKYYFDVYDGDETFPDEEGSELLNHEAARYEATKALTEMANDYIPGDGLRRAMSIHIRDETGARIMEVALNFAVISDTK